MRNLILFIITTIVCIVVRIVVEGIWKVIDMGLYALIYFTIGSIYGYIWNISNKK